MLSYELPSYHLRAADVVCWVNGFDIGEQDKEMLIEGMCDILEEKNLLHYGYIDLVDMQDVFKYILYYLLL